MVIHKYNTEITMHGLYRKGSFYGTVNNIKSSK